MSALRLFNFFSLPSVAGQQRACLTAQLLRTPLYLLLVGLLATVTALEAAAEPPKNIPPAWQVHYEKSLILRDFHRLADAREAGLRALATATPEADRAGLVKCHTNLGTIAVMRRAWPEADEHLKHALSLIGEHGELPAERVPLLLQLANARLHDERHDAAESTFLEIVQICRASQAPAAPPLPQALHALGKIALLRGDLKAADSRFEESLAATRALPDLTREALDAHLDIASLYAARARPAEATRHFNAALDEAAKSGDRAQLIDTHKLLLAFQQSRAEHPAACHTATTIVRLWREIAREHPSTDSDLQLALALVDLSRHALSAGERGTAEHACREALALATRAGAEQGGEIFAFELALADTLLGLDQLPEAQRRFAALYSRLEQDTPANDARHLDVTQAPFYRRYAALLKKTGHLQSAQALDALGCSLAAHAAEQESLALSSAREALSFFAKAREEPGGLPAEVLRSSLPLEWIGRVLLAQQQPGQAASAYREALSALDPSLPRHAARRARLEGDLATCLRVQKLPDDALANARLAVDSWSAASPLLPRQIAAARLICTELLDELGRHEEAAAYHADTQRLQSAWASQSPAP